MQEQLITFETAKLAKEKGFDFRCEKAYFETKEHILETRRDSEITFKYKPPRILKRNYGDEFTIFIAEAPTQSLLQKWLRVNHKIDITIMIVGDSGYEYYIHKNRKVITNNTVFPCSPEELKNLYEKTLELVLQEALKLI